MVHRPIPIKEARRIDKANKALEAKFGKLDKLNFVDWESVQPKQDVIDAARRTGEEIHMGSLMELCHEKNAQLKLSEPEYKGRIVFRGDIVKDASNHLAVFSEQGTSASRIEAAKMMDALSKCWFDEEECDGEESDARSAYTQAMLGGCKTWIEIPRHYWPKSWYNPDGTDRYIRPVVILLRNLYGHPKAGLYWEQHCRGALQSLGWEPVKGWECLFVHKEFKLFLSVYVDDFKMAGKKSSLPKAWEQLRTKLDLDDPTKMDGSIYLGCRQDAIPVDDCLRESMKLWSRIYNLCSTRVNQTSQDADDDAKEDQPKVALMTLGQSSTKGEKPQVSPRATKVTGVEQAAEFGMYPESRHTAISGSALADRADSSSCSALAGKGLPLGSQGKKYKRPEKDRIKAWEYNMIGHCEGAIEKYLNLAQMTEADLRPCATPCLDDHLLAEEDFKKQGELHSIAARIVLTVLYLSRHNRPETFWSTNHLSRDLTKWTRASDKRLMRLMSFLHYTKDCVQFCYVGDHIKDCFLIQFCDAGFAGDLGDSRSTGGSITYLIGPNTLVPLSWACKKQGAVSHSSTEAEIISLDAGLRCEGLPLLMLWEQIQLVMTGSSNQPVQRTMTSNGMYKLDVDFVPRTMPEATNLGRLVILEDNDAVIKMLIRGRTDRLRHVPRTHRIDLDWLFEIIKNDPGINIKYISTKLQAADIFTKGSFTSEQFLHLMFMCCIARTTKSQDKELLKQSSLVEHPSCTVLPIIIGSLLGEQTLRKVMTQKLQGSALAEQKAVKAIIKSEHCAFCQGGQYELVNCGSCGRNTCPQHRVNTGDAGILCPECYEEYLEQYRRFKAAQEDQALSGSALAEHALPKEERSKENEEEKNEFDDLPEVPPFPIPEENHFEELPSRRKKRHCRYRCSYTPQGDIARACLGPCVYEQEHIGVCRCRRHRGTPQQPGETLRA